MFNLISFINSTITTGERINAIVSRILVLGSAIIPNRSLSGGINITANINKLETKIAKNSHLFPPIPVLNIDFEFLIYL